MILDAENTFDDDAALEGTRLSTNVIDLGPLTSDDGTNTFRGIADGKEAIWFYFQVSTVLDSAADGASLVITIESDDAATIDDDPTTHHTSASIAEATLVAGYEYKLRLPPGQYKRYLAARYTVSGEDFTSGAISAALARDIDNRRDYARGYNESVA